ncbi:uncharacterized protein LOC115628387 [Scaptodrosophila lebanonensis]|uniref:Non-structural maintenance of chromosomes element 4 n=1 Tax=Drosophila lebanonensis TaxID=7225 RepID=A0A6J2TUW2_DROLE|nr:uncharacterized protein LOC115628387 [Scaptodrosophila lebanonensis]
MEMNKFSTEDMKSISLDDIVRVERLMKLQDLIEENIEIDTNVEVRGFEEAVGAITTLCEKANEITKDFKKRSPHPMELVLDCDLLRRNYEVVGKAIKNDLGLTDLRFAKAIRELVYKDDEEDWDVLCDLACQHSRSLFINSSMLPFIDVKPKQQVKKKRVLRKRKPKVAEKRPNVSDKLDRPNKVSTLYKKVYEQTKTIYQDGNFQPIPYYKLVIDPDNFINSAHNALMVSFIVAENLISIRNGADGLPEVTVVTSPDEVAENKPGQAICQMDVQRFEKYIKYYKIKKPMISRLFALKDK